MSGLSNVLLEKESKLDRLLAKSGGGLLAFSGGVDSSYLLARAVKALGDRVLAVTAVTPFLPVGEEAMALQIAISLEARHEIVRPDVLSSAEVVKNPSDRCYHCKKEIFAALRRVAEGSGLSTIFDGTNASDMNERRPGRRALTELGVISPLAECGITKEEVRALSRAQGLPNWAEPPQTCLATRFPYGTPLTLEGLKRIGKAEAALRELGLGNLRFRSHGDIARLELSSEKFAEAVGERRPEIIEIAHIAGFKYVTIDLEGYRFGSMDESLPTLES
ncbi:MAG: TIGR00268 family protein [Deltaproteobacteria bacterium]|nr:MAG: TIGR00268 family protein [Deltaproteobacteria bacterium]